MDRRKFLRSATTASIFGLGGCLRLTGESTPTPDEGELTASPPPESSIRTQQETEAETKPETEAETDPDEVAAESLFSVQWQNENSVIAPMSLRGNYLYGVDARGVVKLNKNSGEVIWQNVPQHARDDNGVSAMQATEEATCILEAAYPDESPPEKGRLFALDPETGEENWYFEGDSSEWLSSDAFDASEQYVAFAEESGESSETVRVFDVTTGDVVLERNQETYVNQLLLQGGNLCVIGEKVEIIDVETETVLGERELPASRGVMTDNAVYAGQGGIHRLTIPNLETDWESTMPGRIGSYPTFATDSKLLVGMTTGVYCLEADSGDVEWSYRSADEIIELRGGIEIVNNLAFFWDNAGYLYVVGIETGSVYFDQREKSSGASSSGLQSSGETLYIAFDTEEEATFPTGTTALTISGDFG